MNNSHNGKQQNEVDLSVVIPTYDRPTSLRRAIRSSLTSGTKNSLEVIVVPNGPHDSWKTIFQEFSDDTRVKWHPIPIANACAARNMGLKMSAGRFIRFLDDDDYLLPQAEEQLIDIMRTGVDVSTAPNTVTNESGEAIFTYPSARTTDFVSAALQSMAISGMTQGSIFKLATIKDHRWREDIILHDDYVWIVELASNTNIRWKNFNEPTCAYVQHKGPRLSLERRTQENSRKLIKAIYDLLDNSNIESSFFLERKKSAAEAILTHSHSAFLSAPVFFSREIRKAKAIFANSTPAQPIFSRHPLLSRHLLIFEWLFLPIRLLRLKLVSGNIFSPSKH